MVWLIEHEPLINVVIDSKRKMLTSLTKRYVIGSGVRSSPDADATITGGEAEPNPCMVPMWNVVNRSCPSKEERLSQERPMAWLAEDEGGSEGQSVIDWIEGATFPHAKAGRLPSGLSARERLTNRSRR
jgi:hypothetical protein